jgi:aspartate 1-decarboxylase
MFVTVLKSKIHRATVTASELEYEGSITIDATLIKAANLIVGEKVLVANFANGARVETYVIEGKPDSGIICMNGAAAHHFKVGDVVIIMAFIITDEKKARAYKPLLVKVDKKNKIVKK